MSVFDSKEIHRLLRDWSNCAVTKLKAEGVYLFGSLVYKDGEQFDKSSDIDLVIVMPPGNALTRHRWMQDLLVQKEGLEISLFRMLKRSGHEPIVSIVATTSTEIELDIHKDGYRQFFTENFFLDPISGDKITGLEGAGSKEPTRFVAGALGFTQKIRNEYFAVSANTTAKLLEYGGSDPLPKRHMRAAAMAARERDENLAPGAEYDVKEGLDFLFGHLLSIRRTDPAFMRLQDLLSVRRRARGAERPVEALDQLLLSELIYDLALNQGDPAGVSGTGEPVPPGPTDPPAPAAPVISGTVEPGSDSEADTVEVAPIPGRSRTRPSLLHGSSTVFFAERFAKAFPGDREMTWYEDRQVIAMRLSALLEPPLVFAEDTPIWWWRGGNLQIERFERLEDNLFLMNYEELSIRRIAAVPGATYKWNFVYVETDAMEPTGLYEHDPEELKKIVASHGYASEEYGLYMGRHLLTRGQYDDGAAMINDRLIDTSRKSSLRKRYITPYNFVIAPHDSPLNNANFDQRLLKLLNEALQSDGSVVVEQLREEVAQLPLRAWSGI